MSNHVWTGTRQPFLGTETWVSVSYPNYQITHDDGARYYIANHVVAGALGRFDKFFKAVDHIHEDHKRSTSLDLDFRCRVELIHPDQVAARCVKNRAHQLFDEDHEDEHGCKAGVLVHQATIREVQRVQEARDKGEII